MKFSKTDDPPKYYEVLDQLRNGHDRFTKRGYDYDGLPRWEEQVSEHITFVMAGACCGCHGTSAIILPNGKAYCGPCLRQTAEYKAKKAAKEERYGV